MKKVETERKRAQSNTPYDDVYRTMANDCRMLLIPLINEVFGESFTGNEQVVFSPNEHFINRPDGEEEKRITDSNFTIIGVETKKYLFECQSTPDNSMLVRIFEYATQVALDENEIVADTLRVEIPNCAVLFLRCTKNTPDEMHLEIAAPKGTLVIDVPVMKAQRYSLEEIFEKKLLFLIPFYIFTYDRKLAEYEADAEKLALLRDEYAGIVEQLDALVEQGQLSAYYRKVILEMSTKVVEHLAARYETVKEGVRSVMGGKVLEYEAKTIYREGMQVGMREGKQAGLREGKQAGLREGKQVGLREGEQIGREQKLIEQIKRKLSKHQSVEQIADALEETPERIQELMQTLSEKKA